MSQIKVFLELKDKTPAGHVAMDFLRHIDLVHRVKNFYVMFENEENEMAFIESEVYSIRCSCENTTFGMKIQTEDSELLEKLCKAVECVALTAYNRSCIFEKDGYTIQNVPLAESFS